MATVDSSMSMGGQQRINRVDVAESVVQDISSGGAEVMEIVLGNMTPMFIHVVVLSKSVSTKAWNILAWG